VPTVYIPENKSTQDYTNHLEYNKIRLPNYGQQKGVTLSAHAKFDNMSGQQSISYIKRNQNAKEAFQSLTA